MKKIIVCIATLFLLSGCGTIKYHKQPFSQAEFNKDIYECEKDARQSFYFGVSEFQSFINRCMGARGYRVEDTFWR